MGWKTVEEWVLRLKLRLMKMPDIRITKRINVWSESMSCKRVSNWNYEVKDILNTLEMHRFVDPNIHIKGTCPGLKSWKNQWFYFGLLKVKVKVQVVYSLISSLKTYHRTLHFTPWSLDLFIHVPFQLPGEYTVLQPFRRTELIVHIAISVLPGTHFTWVKWSIWGWSVLPKDTSS